METTEQKTQRDDLVTVMGGVELQVTMQDGSKEAVKVRQIPISKLQDFSMAVGFGNMADAIEFYCDKEKGWGDRLSYNSAKIVLEKGCELNLPFFAIWLSDQRKWREAFNIAFNGAIDTEKPTQRSPLGNLQRPSPTTTASPQNK